MKKADLILVLFGLSVGSVFAGTKDGGGGATVICNGPDGKVAKAELLDLYEAVERYGLSVTRTSQDPALQLKAAFAKLEAYNWYLASDVEEALGQVESKVEFLRPGVIMAPGVDLGDSYAAIIPNGCQLAYAGYYESDGTLRISRDIWNLLDSTNRAALIMHEALYLVARNITHQKNSLSSRKVNGYVFSDTQDLSPLDSAIATMTWRGKFDDSGLHFMAPVKVQAWANPTWSVRFTMADQSTFTSTNAFVFECYDQQGTELDLKYLNEVDLTGLHDYTITVPAKDCRTLLFQYTGPKQANAEIQYGNLSVIGGSSGDYRSDPNWNQMAVALPIYLDRNLNPPTQIPN